MVKLASDSWVLWGANAGEWFVVVFLTVVVVSVRWWPQAGEAIARRIAGGPRHSRPSRPSDAPDDD
ncbi:MAG: hypothetical protein JW940_36565 [Polyangiaceae bacterium]|nr:hypothetical protein [Polyangiaceae bacterium]